MFGRKFEEQRDTVILLRKDGFVWILASGRDNDWMEAPISEIRNASLFCYDGADPGQDFRSTEEKLWNAAGLDGGERLKVGVFIVADKMGPEGIAGVLQRKLEREEGRGRLELADIERGVCLVMAIKDDLEINFTEHACGFVSNLLQYEFLEAILDCFTDDEATQKVTHAQLSDRFEEVFKEPSLAYIEVPEGESYGSCYRPIVQSGGDYDMRREAKSTEQYISDDIIIVSLGAHCEDYCCNLARTYLFNAPKDVQNIYSILLEVRDVCLAAMLPGKALKSVYASAVGFLRQKAGFEYLESKLHPNLGFGIGLVFHEKLLSLTAENDELFEEAMTFCLSVSFENLKRTIHQNSFSYALTLADTVQVVSDGPAKVLTAVPYHLGAVAIAQNAGCDAVEEAKTPGLPGMTRVEKAGYDAVEEAKTPGLPGMTRVEKAGYDAVEEAKTPGLPGMTREQVQVLEAICNDVEKECEEEDYHQLQAYLHAKRDNVLEKSRLTATAGRPRNVAFSPSTLIRPPAKRSKISSNTEETIPMAGATEMPIPGHSLYVPIDKSFTVDESEELSFVPYLEESEEAKNEERVESLLSSHNTTYREKLMAYGSECEQEKRNDAIDETLRRVMGEPNLSHYYSSPQSIVSTVAQIMGEDDRRIQERFDVLALPRVDGRAVGDDSQPATTDPDATPLNLDESFLASMDSYRSLWCRRCYTYDCNLHGIRDKQSPNTQLAIALRKEASGFWAKFDCTSAGAKKLVPRVRELSTFQQSLCKPMMSIMNGDFSKIARVLRAPEKLVRDFAARHQLTPINVSPPPPTKSNHPYFSVKNYKQPFYNRYRDAEIFPFFFPCAHDEECSEETCSCIDASHFCTLACGWGAESRNFFRGCDCKGPCNKIFCTCFGARRECDPDLCKCTTCTDPPNQLALTQRCRNDNILMQRSRPLLIGRSQVAGWGLFTRHALKAGDFVADYVGECISQEEADRRGQIDDARDRSYLFQVASDMVIDAKYKGNKTRFINHSETPNIEPRSTSCSDNFCDEWCGFIFSHCALWLFFLSLLQYCLSKGNNELLSSPFKTFRNRRNSFSTTVRIFRSVCCIV